MSTQIPTSGKAELTPLHDRALQDLSFIRRTMEGASSFTDVPGWGLVVVGTSALIAAPIAHAQSNAALWLTVWITEAALAVMVAVLFIWKKAKQRVKNSGGPAFGIAARKFLFCFWPSIFAGALLTFALLDWKTARIAQSSVPGHLPGIWLLLYGVAVLTAGAYSVKAVPVMGASFMLLGALSLFMPLFNADLVLALGFGGIHMGMGVFIARKHGG